MVRNQLAAQFFLDFFIEVLLRIENATVQVFESKLIIWGIRYYDTCLDTRAARAQ